MGANTIFNVLRGSDNVLLAEGVNIFSVDVPPAITQDVKEVRDEL